MSNVNLTFAALNYDCADPAALAEFWGRVLGRPFGPGALPGDMAVDATEPELGPRLVFHPVPATEPGTVGSSVSPILLTEHYMEEVARLTGLGAKPLDETKLPEVHFTKFADPGGNEFLLVTWKPE